MHHVLFVRVSQRLCNTRHNRQHLSNRQQLPGFGHIQQVLALEELHRDVGEVVLFTSIENGHDVLVLQAPCCFGLAEKPFTGIRQLIALKLLAQGHGLDRHHTPDLGVLAQIHHAHRAFAQFPFNLVATQHGLFDTAAVEKHGAARVRPAAAQNDGFRQILCAVESGLQVPVVLVVTGHVFVHRLGLVELPLALEIKRQVVHVVHQRVGERHAAETVEGHVQLSLALQRQAHHAVGFG